VANKRPKRRRRPPAPQARPERTRYCSLQEAPPRVFSRDVGPERARIILMSAAKWVNGTVLRYHFMKSPASWSAPESERNVVRQAFKTWKALGTGLEFKEVDSPTEAEIRIGFLQGDGSWSYIGRDVLPLGTAERTMNFGWRLGTHPPDLDTALHEIGHTLGFPHEHQNPNAGIVWNEDAVYASLAQPPNSWSRDTTFRNIIRKINPDSVQGSSWDPDSVMHYPFEAGLILEPAQYRTGLNPAGGLSGRDRDWLKTFYPPLAGSEQVELVPLKSVQLSLKNGEQRNFRVNPTATRYYEMRTFGSSDTVMVLFEEVHGELRYRAGDDDSGEDRNAYIRARLYKGRKYVLRLRLYYAMAAGDTAVMLW
jgi:hypothetical protein